MSLSPDESLAQIEADVRRSEERASRFPAFETAIAQARGRGVSAGRDIVVSVDSTGRVVDLQLSEQALARGARRLTHELLATIRAAESDVRAATLDAAETLLGADDPLVEQLRATTPTP